MAKGSEKGFLPVKCEVHFMNCDLQTEPLAHLLHYNQPYGYADFAQ